MPQPGGIVVAEPISPIVSVPSELRLAFLGLEPSLVGTKTKITSADVDLFLCHRNFSAAISVRAVNPIVQSVIKTVQAMLLIAFAKSAEKSFAQIRFAIAVGVLGVKNFGSGAD